MQIGFDAKRAFYNASGLGNYSRSLIIAIHRFYPEEKLFLFSPGDGKPGLRDFISAGEGVKIVKPQSAFGRLFPSLWRSKGILKDIEQNELQLYHGLSNELPAGFPGKKIKSVVTIHDLIFKRYPQYYPLIDRKIYDAKSRRSCKGADKIIAISEQTKKDIIDFYGIEPGKIEVIYQAAGNYLRNDITIEEINTIKSRYGLPGEYLLSVGTIEERKNLLLVLKALTAVKKSVRIPLVIVGKPTDYMEVLQSFISKNKLQKEVIFLESISTSDLQSVYAGAKLFIYPSRFEGFGIPIIEALHYGIPVIAAKGSSLEEAGGTSSVYVDPNNGDELSASIEKLLLDNAIYIQIAKEGRGYVKKFNAEAFARLTMECYRNLVLSN